MISSEVKLKVVDGAGEEKQPRVIRTTEGVDQHSLAWAERVLAGNRRPAVAHTKSRGQVAGGGRKPWRQKGTGRARQGSIRAIQWRGGGVAFGPGGADYHRELNRKQRRRATRSALLDKSQQGQLVLVDSNFPAEPRSKQARVFLDKLGMAGRVLILLGRKDEEIKRAFRNLSDVKLLMASRLNALDIMLADYLLVSPAAGEIVSGLLEPAKSQKKDEK